MCALIVTPLRLYIFQLCRACMAYNEAFNLQLGIVFVSCKCKPRHVHMTVRPFFEPGRLYSGSVQALHLLRDLNVSGRCSDNRFNVHNAREARRLRSVLQVDRLLECLQRVRSVRPSRDLWTLRTLSFFFFLMVDLTFFFCCMDNLRPPSTVLFGP